MELQFIDNSLNFFNLIKDLLIYVDIRIIVERIKPKYSIDVCYVGAFKTSDINVTIKRQLQYIIGHYSTSVNTGACCPSSIKVVNQYCHRNRITLFTKFGWINYNDLLFLISEIPVPSFNSNKFGLFVIVGSNIFSVKCFIKEIKKELRYARLHKDTDFINKYKNMFCFIDF